MALRRDHEVQATRCIDIIEAVARGHGARFADLRPAHTMVVVGALLDPAWLVEIETEAVIGATGHVRSCDHAPTR